jgi:hypothetical protein
MSKAVSLRGKSAVVDGKSEAMEKANLARKKRARDRLEQDSAILVQVPWCLCLLRHSHTCCLVIPEILMALTAVRLDCALLDAGSPTSL